MLENEATDGREWVGVEPTILVFLQYNANHLLNPKYPYPTALALFVAGAGLEPAVLRL